MGAGGGGNTTQVQKADPWEKQQPYLQDVYAQYQNLFQNYAPQYFPESGVAGLSPYTEKGVSFLNAFGNSPYYQQGAIASQGALQNLNKMQSPWQNPLLGMGYGNMLGIDDYLKASLSGQNKVNYDPAQAGQVYANYQNMVGGMTGNPQLDAMVNAAQTRTAQNFNEQVMPQISMSALGNNAFGGSRQGIAEGLAADRLQQQMGDIATQMYGGAYESGQNRALQGATTQAGLTNQTNLSNAANMLQAQLVNQQLQQYAANMGMSSLTQGMNQSMDSSRLIQAMLPSYAQYGMIPGQNYLQAGQMDQQYRQALLDDEMARWNWTNALPAQLLQQYAQGIYGGGSPGGTTTSTGQGASTSPLLGAIGGAGAGAGIASMMGLTGAAAFAPWLLGGAVLGGLASR